tara:strand:- start:1011 stop:1229 length:219 start_codon:yes stop_codon:yes gene_type:complete
MAIKIVSGGNYVSKVVIGTPIKRVKGALNMSNLADVDLTGLSDGDLLQFDSASQKFIVSTSLGGQVLNGGNF